NKEAADKTKAEETDAIMQRHSRRMEAALQKKTKDSQLKALYEEGVYCYKNKRYALAKDAFSKALEINPNHVKSLDYIHIYIPEAESTPE
ncbi:MAG: tetratricopeptide repeat protein, partial [Candidatus Omnitrophica bacterium]|nr:tetratricopeptide repeat protein [Candidatus Omnitrophota bacterium]